MKWFRENKEMVLFVSSTLLLSIGGGAWLLGHASTAAMVWTGGTALGLVASLAWTVAAIRNRQLSVDIIAVLAQKAHSASNMGERSHREEDLARLRQH